MVASLLMLFSVTALAADLGPELLVAAKKGQTERVQTLAGKGASLDSKDKDGRTALMLAAEHGHLDTVRALLAKGASTAARDKQGWTAYALALFSSAGRREEIMKSLPQPAIVRLKVDAVSGPENVYSSCFMRPQQLAEQVRAIQVESRVVDAIRDAATAATAKPPVELVVAGEDVVLTLRVRPRAVCVQQQTSDKVSLEVDVRVVRNGDGGVVLEKTFGGGFKGMREQLVTSPAQYAPVFDEWAKKHGGAIYWGVVEALLLSEGAPSPPSSSVPR